MASASVTTARTRTGPSQRAQGHDGGQAGETLHGCHAADFDAPAPRLLHAVSHRAVAFLAQPREREGGARVRLVLGDDMEIVYSPDSRDPITLFDGSGRVVRVEYPQLGETTRDVLIRMLRPPPMPGP